MGPEPNHKIKRTLHDLANLENYQLNQLSLWRYHNRKELEPYRLRLLLRLSRNLARIGGRTDPKGKFYAANTSANVNAILFVGTDR